MRWIMYSKMFHYTENLLSRTFLGSSISLRIFKPEVINSFVDELDILVIIQFFEQNHTLALYIITILSTAIY